MYNCVLFTDFTDTTMVQKTLGAYKCANELRNHGYTCLVVDHFHSWQINEIVELLQQVVSSDTYMVGFSTSFFQNSNVEPDNNGALHYLPLDINTSFCPQGPNFENVIVQKIKSINANCQIVVGGTKTQRELKNRNIDYAVIGHAEVSIINLLDHLKNNTSLANSYKNIWGITVLQDPEAKKYNFANGHMVWQDYDVVNAKVLPLESARGCIFNCRFCGYPMRGKKNLDYVRNGDSIYRELQENYDRWGITTYSLMDDTFNDNDEKLDLILSAVSRLTFQPKFWSYSRLDLLSLKPDRLGKMVDIGIRAMFLGIETLNDRTGKIIGKGYSRQKQIDTIEQIRRQYNNQIMLHGSFIIGLPEETKEDIHKTFDALMDETIPLHSFRFQPLRIFRNTMAWPSDFDINYQNYGYEDQNPDFPLELDWKNKYMTRNESVVLAKKFHVVAEQANRYYIPNQTAWALLNYGYNIDYLSNTKNNQLDWFDISSRKQQHIQDYKQQLLIMLTKENNEKVV